MDRGDWWATIYGVKKNGIQLSTHAHTHTHVICNLLKLYKNTYVYLYRYVWDRCQQTNTGFLSFFLIGVQLLYDVMLVSAVKQRNPLYVHIHPLPLEPSSHPLSHPSRPLQRLSWAPCAIQQFPTSYFTHCSVYTSILFSRFGSPSPSFPVSTCMFSTSVSLFLPWKQVYLYPLSGLHTYTLTHNIYFYFSDFFYSV